MKLLTKFFSWLIVGFAVVLSPTVAHAQEQTPQNYITGTVTAVTKQSEIPGDGEEVFYLQTVEVQRSDNNQNEEVNLGSEYQPLTSKQLLKVGTKIVMAEQTAADGSTELVYTDIYRLNTIYILFALFVVVVVVIGGVKGGASFMGMLVSLLILLLFVVPHILSGENPFMIGLFGSAIIGVLTIYISHGFSLKSHIALGSIFAVLLLVAGLSTVAVEAAHLAGLGSEEAYYLQFTQSQKINLQGLLLAGILLGTLGVLDDITISQTSIVFELKKAKKEMDWLELYERGLSIGKDHVASLVNTLVLAYAGANLPLFLLIVMNTQSPVWVTINSEILVEEMIRTIVGSVGLVLAVPLSTFLAAQIVVRKHKHT